MMGQNKAIRNPMPGVGRIPCRVSGESAMGTILRWRRLRGAYYWWRVYLQLALSWQHEPHR